MTDKRRIFLIQETTRYEDSTIEMNVPDDIEIVYEGFYFDTKDGDMYDLLENVPVDIERLKAIKAEVADHHQLLDTMIREREEWLEEVKQEEEQRKTIEAQVREDRLQAARELLYETGELPRP